MIHHLSGRLVEKNPSFVVIECNGVGYHVNVSLSTYGKLGSEEQVKLLTHLAIRDDAHVLYGFADAGERELFRMLISVSGVGTSTAQVMLSSLNAEEIVNAIVQGDVNTLKGVKGIGAKTAQRVIIDLKDKLTKVEDSMEFSEGSHNTAKTEALSALASLGFDKSKAGKVLDKLLVANAEDSVEELIKKALKQL